MAAVALLATAACGGADDQEISTGADGQASSSDTAAADEADAADVGTSDSGTSANELEGTGDDDSAFSADDSTEEDLPEAPTDDDPSGEGETSSASSGDEDYGDSSSSSGSSDGASSDDGSAASSSSDETDDASDLDDTVSVTNDGSGTSSSDGSSGGQGTSGGEQPVEQPDGTTTFGPQQGERELAYITDVQPVVRESWPLQLAVIIAGELRDGCQDLAWELTPDGTTYRISVWQVQQATEMACTMALVPFETQIELGTSETEDFTVIVNGLSY